MLTLHHVLVNDLPALDLVNILWSLRALGRTLDNIALCHCLLFGLSCRCHCDLHSSINLLRLLAGLAGEYLWVVA
jgi:hypothetical protein